MPIDKENIYRRLNELIQVAQSQQSGVIGEISSGTISILEKLYGANSEKLRAYIQMYQDYVKDPRKDIPRIRNTLRHTTSGVLTSIKSEVELGLVSNLELQAQGGIFGDFITLARQSLDENKDVAAVLVSAALEDALKRFALQNDLDVANANMEQVINALKNKGLLKEPQASIAKGHKELRKKAFHANWDKIEKASVNSAIGFTETFVLENFG